MIKKLLALSVMLIVASTAFADKKIDGREVFNSKKHGNCTACHWTQDMYEGDIAGNMGPALVGMKARFPNKKDLREQIWDPTIKNPITSMPPFGKNAILTPEQIDAVVDYLYTL